MVIKNNRIHHAGRGMWMDWMAQGTRITGNLCYDNSTDDLFVEVNHGPFLVDNNVFLSPINLRDWSEGGAYAHNLMSGCIDSRPELKRSTPFHQAHSTALAGLTNIHGGDNRFFNNILVGGTGQGNDAHYWDSKNPKRFVGYGLWVYNTRENPLQTGGNVYFNNARPCFQESNPLAISGIDPKPRIVEDGNHVYLQLNLGTEWKQAQTKFVKTELLGKAIASQLAYENPDGSSLSLDADYLGHKRSEAKPTAGPFENPGEGEVILKVW